MFCLLIYSSSNNGIQHSRLFLCSYNVARSARKIKGASHLGEKAPSALERDSQAGSGPSLLEITQRGHIDVKRSREFELAVRAANAHSAAEGAPWGASPSRC